MAPCAAGAVNTVQVNCSTNTYTVNGVVAGGAGSISATSQIVSDGNVASFTITPGYQHQIVSVTGCGGSLSGNTYTTGPITAACTVNVQFGMAATLVPMFDNLGLLLLALALMALALHTLRRRTNTH